MTPTLDQFIEQVLQKERLHLYFDTTVILDLLRPKRRPASHELLDLARTRQWECTGSYFALMEALDTEQENMWFRTRIRAGEDADFLLRRRPKRDLGIQALRRVSNQLYRKFVEEVEDFISWIILDEEGWDEALRLAMNSNISAKDCVHVATALKADCNLFITSDEVLRELAQEYVRTANPQQAVASLRRMAAGRGKEEA